MTNAEITMDKILATSLEKLKILRDGDNKELPNIETYVSNEISALLDAEAPIREYWSNRLGNLVPLVLGRVAPHEINKTELSGSVVEGAMTARIFQVDKDHLELEIDVMANNFTISQEMSRLLEPVKDKPGFVRLPFRLWPTDDDIDAYIDSAKRFLERHENEQYSLEQMQQYISPLVIRDTYKDMSEKFSVSNFTNNIRDICGLDSMNAPEPKVNISQTETTTAYDMYFDRTCGEAHPDFRPDLSFDIVPAVHLAFWPRQASDWIIRYRAWPPHDTIQCIVDKGCQVVPRTSPGGDVHSEWRLSFSRPEATLAKLRSKEQEQAYTFFKMFFYRYLKCIKSSETDGKPLFSYVIKTIM